jgi:hypothetical protein
MHGFKYLTLVGGDLVGTPMLREAVYRVSLAAIASGCDPLPVACFDLRKREWLDIALTRRDHPELFEELERGAAELAPDQFQALEALMTPLPPIPDSARISHLVDDVMRITGATRKDLADRLGIQAATLREYCLGTGRGNMGPTLVLALEALLERKKLN